MNAEKIINNIGGATDMSGLSKVSTPTKMTGSSAMSGPTETNGPTEISGSSAMNEPTEINGPTEISGSSAMNEPTEINGPTEISGSSAMNEPTEINGPTAISGPTEVSGPPEMNETNKMKSSAPDEAPGAQAKFTFARIQYRSGDWNTDQRMPSNILNSLIEYTTIPVNLEEKVVELSGTEIFGYPFCYLSGHKLVQFDNKEAANFKKYVQNGGFVFVDDCNHDIDGLFAKSFEAQMNSLFGPGALKKIPNNHKIYNSFFSFEKGPPNTSFELNGWGDDLIHDYLKAIEVNGRIGVLYSNKDYGCEWDYDFRNKRFLAEDNTKFGVNIIVYAML